MNKNFEIISSAEWRAYCQGRWDRTRQSYLFLILFFVVFCGGLSYSVSGNTPLLQPYKEYIGCSVGVIVCALLAYRYYRLRNYFSVHYEDITSVSVTNEATGESKTYPIVRLRYGGVTDWNIVGLFDEMFILWEVSLLFRRHILFVRDPESDEIFGYCPKCHELIELRLVTLGVCPNCGKHFLFFDCH